MSGVDDFERAILLVFDQQADPGLRVRKSCAAASAAAHAGCKLLQAASGAHAPAHCD